MHACTLKHQYLDCNTDKSDSCIKKTNPKGKDQTAHSTINWKAANKSGKSYKKW